MTQWLRALAALAEDPDSIPSTSMGLTMVHDSNSTDSSALSDLLRHCTTQAHLYTCREYNHTCKIKINRTLKC